MKTVNLLWCVETGILEQQSKLLIKSINQWRNRFKVSLNAYSPRISNKPNEQTCQFLKKHDINHVTKPLNQNFLCYPIANKLMACADYENDHQDIENIIFVDTDTVFLNPISDNLLSNEPALYLRPVDNKGPGSESMYDGNDVFWQQIYKLFNLPLPKPDLYTTVRPACIRPYYNAGFIWANKIPGFFTQCYNDFLAIVDSGLRPYAYKSRDGDDFRCLDQVALAVTASRYSEYIKILPETYNYPIPFRPIMKNRDKHPGLNNLIHIHYHKWFQHPGFLDHVTSDEDKMTAQYQWLKKQLPLHPTIDGPFKC